MAFDWMDIKDILYKDEIDACFPVVEALVKSLDWSYDLFTFCTCRILNMRLPETCKVTYTKGGETGEGRSGTPWIHTSLGLGLWIAAVSAKFVNLRTKTPLSFPRWKGFK